MQSFFHKYTKWVMKVQNVFDSDGKVIGYQVSPLEVIKLAIVLYVIYSKPNKNLPHATNGLPTNLGVIKLGVDARRMNNGRPQLQISFEFPMLGYVVQSKHNLFALLLADIKEEADSYDEILTDPFKAEIFSTQLIWMGLTILWSGCRL